MGDDQPVAAQGATGTLGLLLNAQPAAAGALDSLEAWCRDGDADRRPQVIIELTERALTAHPTELLTSVGHLRRSGCAHRHRRRGRRPPLAGAPAFLRPDVIKLDLRLVQSRPTHEIRS